MPFSPRGAVTLGSKRLSKNAAAPAAPNKRPVKEQVAIRLSPEVLAAFRADGPGWQTRIDAVLRQYVEQQRSAP